MSGCNMGQLIQFLFNFLLLFHQINTLPANIDASTFGAPLTLLTVSSIMLIYIHTHTYESKAQTHNILHKQSRIILHQTQYLPSFHSALGTPQKRLWTREPSSWLSWKASFGNVNKSLFTISIFSVNSVFKSCNTRTYSRISANTRVLFLG